MSSGETVHHGWESFCLILCTSQKFKTVLKTEVFSAIRDVKGYVGQLHRIARCDIGHEENLCLPGTAG